MLSVSFAKIKKQIHQWTKSFRIHTLAVIHNIYMTKDLHLSQVKQQ